MTPHLVPEVRCGCATPRVSTSASVIAAVIAGGLAFGAVSGLAALLPHTASGQLSWGAAVVQLVVGGVVLVTAYLALAHVTHVREVGQVLDPLLRRVRPRRSFAGD